MAEPMCLILACPVAITGVRETLLPIYLTCELLLSSLDPSVSLVDGSQNGSSRTPTRERASAAFVSYFLAHFRRRPHTRSSIHPSARRSSNSGPPSAITRDLPASYSAGQILT